MVYNKSIFVLGLRPQSPVVIDCESLVTTHYPLHNRLHFIGIHNQLSLLQEINTHFYQELLYENSI